MSIPAVGSNESTGPATTTLEATGPYRNLLNAFLPGISTAAAQAVWQNFLIYYEYSSDPANTNNLAIGQFVDMLRAQNPNSYPTTGAFADLLYAFLGSNAPIAQLQNAWNQFLTTYGYSFNPADTTTTINECVQVLQEIAPNTAYPTSGPFATLINAFLGNSLGPAALENSWRTFLSNYGYTANPSATDTQALNNLTQFLEAVAVETQRYSASPTASQQNQIIFSTFNSLLQFLTNVQNTIAVQSHTLLNAGTLEQNYTKMMTSVPTYTSTAPTDWTIPTALSTSSTPSSSSASDQTLAQEWKLGYNNITVAQVCDWMAEGFATAQPETFTITNQLSGSSNTYMNITFTTGNVQNSTALPEIQFTVVTNGVQQVFSTSVGSSINGVPLNQVSTANLSSQLQTLFIALYQQNQAAISANIQTVGVGPYIPTPYSVSSNTTTNNIILTGPADGISAIGDVLTNKQNQRVAEARGEANTKHQQITANIQAYQNIVQTQAQSTQAFLTQAQNEISQVSNLLTSMLQLYQQIAKDIVQ